MLHELTSDLPDFKTATFEPGLNIVLAERTKKATKQDSRNAVGKTSLVRTIDFLLGSDPRGRNVLRRPELKAATYSLALDVGGRREVATRSIAKPNSIFFDGTYMRLQDWRVELGQRLFGLRGAPDEPSYRSLISFYLRDVTDGAFGSPTETHRKQAAIDTAPALAWLFGLDLQLIAKVKEVLATEGSLKELRKAANDPIVGMTIGRAQDLDANIRTLRIEESRLTSDLNDFKVVDRYADHRAEADQLSAQIRRLNDALVMSERQLSDISRAIETEELEQPDYEYLEDMYSQVDVVLPGSVRRRFNEVEEFHQSIVNNRRRYLESEQVGLAQLIAGDRTRLQELDSRRSDLMRLLEAGGALETYNQLQRELGIITGRLAELEERRDTIQRWENANRHLQLRSAELEVLLSSDLTERAAQIESVGAMFADFAYSIYGGQRPAALKIDPARSGYRFLPTIGGDSSEGVRSIGIFCFDLTMMVTARRIGHGPDFLVHDSHLYDSIEARQVASALTLAAEVAADEGFQYIVTINSDDLEKAQREGFNAGFHESARMTDAYDSGGLYGVRFN
jgi:uncharacterized protein YydD (DUF2326 family)